MRFRLVEKSPVQTPYRRKFGSIRHDMVGVHDGALAKEYVVSSTTYVGGGRRLLKTIAAQLTSTTLVAVQVCLSHVVYT